MGGLFATMLATSAVDSLNPIGITQQFILQGIVKKPRHIWYFIITTAVVNIAFGYLVYYGVISFIDKVISRMLNRIWAYVYLLELLIGIALIVFGIIKLIKKKDANDDDSERKTKKPISVTPLALIGVGIVSTTSELTSALPYFTFLATLISYRLSFWFLSIILILYNIVYIAPFIALFLIYLLSKQKFDSLYLYFKKIVTKFALILFPIFSVIVGILIIVHGITNLIALWRL